MMCFTGLYCGSCTQYCKSCVYCRARTKLWNRDMVDGIPDLINQEIVALRGLLGVLLRFEL
jgi:hypothetical protein